VLPPVLEPLLSLQQISSPSAVASAVRRTPLRVVRVCMVVPLHSQRED
jgi:hypothetical protein